VGSGITGGGERVVTVGLISTVASEQRPSWVFRRLGGEGGGFQGGRSEGSLHSVVGRNSSDPKYRASSVVTVGLEGW